MISYACCNCYKDTTDPIIINTYPWCKECATPHLKKLQGPKPPLMCPQLADGTTGRPLYLPNGKKIKYNDPEWWQLWKNREKYDPIRHGSLNSEDYPEWQEYLKKKAAYEASNP